MPELVSYSEDGGVSRITLSRPERMNALDAAMSLGFLQAVELACDSKETNVILISAEGRAFSGGGDLRAFDAAADQAAAADDVVAPIHQALKLLNESPKISVASLHGTIAGGGFGIALCPDLAIATDTTRFSLGYARIGATPDCGASWHLPMLLGFRSALWLALEGAAIGADDALRLGLVNKVVPADSQARETEALLDRLVSGPPAAISATKMLMRKARMTGFEAQLDLERDSFLECAANADFREGVRAFLERRPAAFRSVAASSPSNPST